MREEEQGAFVGREYRGKRKQAHRPEPGVSSVGEQQPYPPSSDALSRVGTEERSREQEGRASQPVVPHSYLHCL